jgi:hypothetical protein
MDQLVVATLERLAVAAERQAVAVEKIANALERIPEALERQAATCVSAIEPAALSKEDAARYIGEDVATIEHLIRTRKLEYVQHGSQRGRVIPVESLRKFLKEHRQASGEEMLANTGRDRRGHA